MIEVGKNELQQEAAVSGAFWFVFFVFFHHEFIINSGVRLCECVCVNVNVSV